MLTSRAVDWALLSSDLQFIYLDPVLASHLDEQADALVGKSLLSFVHPDEQASAKHDLGSVLESRTLHGSVTRCVIFYPLSILPRVRLSHIIVTRLCRVRYSRLSRVRRQLGYDGPAPPWTDAEKIALDSKYMAVDIVINWAAEGLVLCFIHAIVDLTPNDNDEHHKTGWTNWCGTPLMTNEQIQLLYRRLLVCIPQTGSMSRVFQILSNHQDRPLLMSWPPDQGQGQGPTGRDFAKLVEDVQIGTGVPNGNDAKTSCTRRYKALQNMPALMGGEVESIFIPHGMYAQCQASWSTVDCLVSRDCHIRLPQDQSALPRHRCLRDDSAPARLQFQQLRCTPKSTILRTK